MGMREKEEKRNSKAQQRRYFDLFNSRRNCANNEYRHELAAFGARGRWASGSFVSEMLNTTRCLFIGAYWIDIWPLTQLGAREGGGGRKRVDKGLGVVDSNRMSFRRMMKGMLGRSKEEEKCSKRRVYRRLDVRGFWKNVMNIVKF